MFDELAFGYENSIQNVIFGLRNGYEIMNYRNTQIHKIYLNQEKIKI